MNTIEQKIPQYKERLQKQMSAKAHILHHLEISDEKYSLIQFEFGCQLIDTFFEDIDSSKGIKQKCLTDPNMEFWGWWKLQWNIQEMNFWKANSWMVEKQPAKFFKQPVSNTARFRASWNEEIRLLVECREMHERLHHHIIQINPYLI